MLAKAHVSSHPWGVRHSQCTFLWVGTFWQAHPPTRLGKLIPFPPLPVPARNQRYMMHFAASRWQGPFHGYDLAGPAAAERLFNRVFLPLSSGDVSAQYRGEGTADERLAARALSAQIQRASFPL